MKSFILLFSLAFLMAACEKTIKVEIPERDPKLVINAWLQKGLPAEATIGKSRNVLHPVNNSVPSIENYVVKNAVPVLYENNVAIDTLVYQASSYRYVSSTGRTLREGFGYSIKVNAPGFSTAEASTAVPGQSNIDEVKRNRNARTTSNGQTQDEVLIRFTDPSGADHYLVQIFRSPYLGMEGYPLNCVSTTDKDVEPIGDNADPLSTDNCYDGGSLLVRDVNFAGKQKTLRFFIDSGDLFENTGPSGELYRPYVKVHRITEDYFRFVKSYNVYYNSSDNPFAEPSNVYSNVKNGYGSFSAFTVAVDTLR